MVAMIPYVMSPTGFAKEPILTIDNGGTVIVHTASNEIAFRCLLLGVLGGLIVWTTATTSVADFGFKARHCGLLRFGTFLLLLSDDSKDYAGNILLPAAGLIRY